MDGTFSIEGFLKEVSTGSPCGILDEVTLAQISALDDAVKRGGPERIPVIRRAAEGLFLGGKIPELSDSKGEKTVEVKPIRHLKVAVVLAWSGLTLEGLPGFAAGLTLMHRLLRDRWQEVHPRSNPDYDEDPFLDRFNAVAPLTFPDPSAPKGADTSMVAGDSWGIQTRLLKATLLRSDEHGELSLRDCLSPWAVQRKLSLPPGEDRTPESIYEARLRASAMVPGQRVVLQDAIAAVQGLDQSFKSAPGTLKPNFGYLLKILAAAQAVLDDAVAPVAAAAADAHSGASAKPAGVVGGAVGPISSREEAMRRLAEVSEYFRRTEPSSPVPLLIKRVQSLVGLDFNKLIQELELGDGAVKEFRKLAGIRDDISAEPTAKQ